MTQSAVDPVSSVVIAQRPYRFALCASMVALWAPVTYLTGAQWTLFEQYHYGWAVPFMCLFFAWERIRRPSDLRPPTSDLSSPPSAVRPTSVLRPLTSGPWSLVFSLSALCFATSRFLLEANPTWRAPSWGLAIGAVGITLVLLYVSGGKPWLKKFLFPVAFFFIAVPWPTPIENAVTQNLMHLNVAIVIELLNLFNIPALAHGNVIELSRGVVGVEEACSGIRSLQATLMIALFFGEYFRLRVPRRIGLIFGGVFFAMFFNVCRTFFLSWIASRSGNDAVEKWHDPAGFFVLLCFIATWLLALTLRSKAQSAKRKGQGAEGEVPTEQPASPGTPSLLPLSPLPPTPSAPPSSGGASVLASCSSIPSSPSSAPTSELPAPSSDSASPFTHHVSRNTAHESDTWHPARRISLFQKRFALCASLIAFVSTVELSTHLWFRAHENHAENPIPWSAHWPDSSANFKTRSLPHTTKTMLQCSSESLANWDDSTGHQWQGIYLRWNSSKHFYGRARASLAKGHRPDACLPAMGLTLDSQLPAAQTRVGDLTFNFRRYIFRTMDGQPLYVFFMVADDQTQALSAQSLSLQRADRLQMALAGKRTGGQRSLELAVSGFDSPAAAWSAVETQLPHWISFH